MRGKRAEERGGPRSAAWTAGWLSGVLLLVAALPVCAQAGGPGHQGLRLTPEVRRAVASLQQEWLQWVVAFDDGDLNSASDSVERLAELGRLLGMEKLPDLSRASAAAAVKAAQQRDFERARWALMAAERLDPTRPEIGFAGARVARLEGSQLTALVSQFQGWLRLFRLPLERSIWLSDLLLWLLAVLVFAGALYVLVQMAAKGPYLYGELVELLARFTSRPTAWALAMALTLWPLLLPYGLVWLVAFWSLLLWRYTHLGERAILVGLWFLVGLAPFVVSLQNQRLTVRLSPPAQAMDGLSRGSLGGSLFADITGLRRMLPETIAVGHLLADLHQRLGQWDLARDLYLEVIDAEPDNVAALVNLGVYHYRVGDLEGAVRYFQRAVSADPASAVAYFDLSQAYSASYAFDESEEALKRARSIDARQVSRWIHETTVEGLVTVEGGLERIDQLRRDLDREWHESGLLASWQDVGRRTLWLPASLLVLALVLGIRLARRPILFRPAPRPQAWWRGRTELARRVLLPGLPEAEAGRPVATFLALLVPVALLSLPFVDLFGYRVPWTPAPALKMSWGLAALGLLLFFSLRLLRELRREG